MSDFLNLSGKTVLVLGGASLLAPLIAGLRLDRRQAPRARAGPDELLVPLRC